MIVLRLLRFGVRLLLLIVLLLVGLLITGLLFPLVKQALRERIIQFWSRCLIAVLGVKVKIEGEVVQNGPVMLVANHVSWIDIFLINSNRSTSFVAKQEIESWPFIGRLVRQAGTIFVDRSSRSAMRGVNDALNQRFAEGACTGLFPEGTTSDGLSVKSFFGGLLEAPLKAQVPIQPVAMLFYHRGERSGLAAFIGEQSLVQNIWILLSNFGLAVTVRFLEPITEAGVESDLSRVQAAQLCYERITKEVE